MGVVAVAASAVGLLVGEVCGVGAFVEVELKVAVNLGVAGGAERAARPVPSAVAAGLDALVGPGAMGGQPGPVYGLVNKAETAGGGHEVPFVEVTVSGSAGRALVCSTAWMRPVPGRGQGVKSGR